MIEGFRVFGAVFGAVLRGGVGGCGFGFCAF